SSSRNESTPPRFITTSLPSLPARPALPALLDRGKVSRVHEDAFDLRYDRAVHLRLGADLLPLGIVLERGPVLHRLFATGMLQDVDQRVLRLRRVLRHPVADALHVM